MKEQPAKKTKTRVAERVQHQILPERQAVVGQSVLRLEGREKVDGSAVYIDDMYLPKMLYGKQLRSPHAHARIVSIDASAAMALPEVKAVITAEDLPDHRHGPFVQDQPVLARGYVSFIGEPLAAVAATTLEAAERALDLIRVEYEVLPAVFDPLKAMESDAPIVHENLDRFHAIFDIVRGGNICSHTTIEAGDWEGALAKSDRVFTHSFTTPMQHQAYLEPCGALCTVDAQDRVTCWTTTQSIHLTQSRIANGNGIPMSNVRVIQTRVGGGFGAKVEPSVQPICAALTLKTRLPVKMVLTRQEEMTAMRPRHASVVDITTGVMNDGTITARKIKLIYDTGAWADDGPGIACFGAVVSGGPYKLTDYIVDSYCIYTNKVPTGAMRAFGNPQAAWCGECQLDIIAHELGMDPFEIRHKNAVDVDSSIIGGQKLTSVGLQECLERTRDVIGWDLPKAPNTGRGVATVVHCSGIMTSSAYCRLHEDGTVIVATGSADIGQGSDTVMQQIAAEVLTLPLESVRIMTQDTDATPYNWATTATRITTMAGTAVKEAAEDAKRQILDIAANVLEVSPSSLGLANGHVIDLATGERRFSMGQIGVISLWSKYPPVFGKYTWSYDQPWGEQTPCRRTGFPFGMIGRWIFGAHAVEVEVDPETGVTRVTKGVAAHDVGRAINPMAVEGQAQGGFTQSMGFGLYEDLMHKDGRILCDNLHDYKLPTAMDVPAIEAIIVESIDPKGPFGAKGIGEAPCVPTAPAIGNAIYDAVGVRITDLPATPERVYFALQEQKGTRW